MKEFMLGGLVSIWFVILGLSTLDILYTYLTVIYPMIIGLVFLNYYLIKQVIKKAVKKRLYLKRV